MDRPTRCIDPVVKYCQGCEYGWIKYPDWVETREDLEWCTFDSGCMFGLEDTEPIPEEEAEFERWYNQKQDTDRWAYIELPKE